MVCPVSIIESTDTTIHFEVRSESRPDIIHDVYFDVENGYYCGCEQYHFRKVECKHMRLVKEYMNQLNTLMQTGQTFEEIRYK
ncbi:hypothetical protein [Methanobrevibacter sp.]|jgi:hypothetical protein|uniref:hypothetical protein n=1 Tax=Methanobrevibacter sp. TaxID=66852 RepID=UPI00386D1BDA